MAGILVIFSIALLAIMFREPITGFVSQTSSDLFEKETKLELSGVDQLIVYRGEVKSFSFVGINTGDTVLTGCQLVFGGDYAAWIISQTIQDIKAGEQIEFPAELVISDVISSGTYRGSGEIRCNEISQKQEFSVVVSEPSEILQIISVKPEDEQLDIVYSFDHSNIVGEGVAIDVWLVDEQIHEVARDLDIFTLQQEGVIQRTFALALPASLAGNYKIYLATDSEPEKLVSQEILLGESSATGFSILSFEEGNYSLIGLALIVFIVCAILLFVRLRRKKK
ncbi:MAG: hypothetical protein RL557_797 [archaeon]